MHAQLFALDTQDNRLHLFASAEAAIAACPMAQTQHWLFFTADGEALRPQAMGGQYYLRPWASCAGPRLAQVLHLVRSIEGAGMAPEVLAQVVQRLGYMPKPATD